jgi:Tfp pilus assembly protein PilN
MSRNEVIFTIDLLNGRAIPAKGNPRGLAVLAATAVIPLAVAVGMASFYLHNNKAIALKEKEIAKYETQIGNLSDAVKLQEALQKKKTTYEDSLADVSSSIKQYTQWSPILTALVQNMPDSVVLTSIEVDHKSVKRRVPKKDDPKKMVEVDVLAKTLRLSVSGGPGRNCDEAVRQFRDRLRDSAVLGPKLENIAVAQQSEKRQGRDIVSYQINCLFKPGL